MEVCEEIHKLFCREAKGENVDKQLRECGRKLGWFDRPLFLPEDIATEDYIAGLEIIEQNNIPLLVYKNRIRRGKDPIEAASDPYAPHNQHIKSDDFAYIEQAEKNGISANTYAVRKRRGWTNEQASTLPLGTKLLPTHPKKRKQ